MERKFEKYKIQLDEATIRIFLKGVRWFDLPFGSAINQMEMDDVDSKSNDLHRRKNAERPSC